MKYPVEFSFSLPSIPSTGYTWSADPHGDVKVSGLGVDQSLQDPELVGGTVMERFQVTSGPLGGTVRMTHHRSWETKILREFTLVFPPLAS